MAKSIEAKDWKSLPTELQEKINNYELRVVKILKESDPDVRFMLFQRLNEGAVSLNDQELRNCVHRGEYNDFIKRLSDDPSWRKLLRLRGRHKRMVDAELVLRYMAFRDLTYMAHPDKKTGKFLDNQMVRGRTYSASDYRKAEKGFKQAVSLAISVYGEHACRRFVAGTELLPSGAWDARVNRALMDVQLWGFNRYTKGLIVKHSDAIHEASLELMANPTFSDLISHTISEAKRVEQRFDMWKAMLASVLSDEAQGPRLFSLADKREAFESDPTCQHCGQQIRTLDDAHMDHVEPYSKGGKTSPENAALLHRFCNIQKGADFPTTA